MLISSYWMAHDGKGGKLTFAQPHPTQPQEWMNSQLVNWLLLSLYHLGV